MFEGHARRSIGDLCDFVNGNGFRPTDWRPSGLPIIRIQNLNGSQKFNYFDGEPKPKWIVKPGDLLFAWAGVKGVSFGPTIWPGPRGVLNQHIFRVVPKRGVDKYWLYLALQVANRRIEANAHGFKSSLVHVHKDDITNQVVDFPPLPEQRKIAEILRTWDEAIEKLKALRAAKLRRLGGLRRALLDRAADDPATRTKPLAELARIVKGQQLNKLDISEGEYPVWNGGVTPSGFHNEWNTQGGTITISEGGNSCGFVNLADQPFWLGGHCYAIQDLSQAVERDFLFHVLKSREAEIMRLRVGSGLPNIQRADIERLHVMVPPLDTQRHIARALTAGNEERDLLASEIEALTRQKRGLMQKLLTGEWRVRLEAAP